MGRNFSKKKPISVQFIFFFSQSIIQYMNTYGNCKLAMEPRRNQKTYETGLPSHKDISKMKFSELYRPHCKVTHTP